MSYSTVIIYTLVAYCVIDFIISMVIGSCKLPGLKCKCCRSK
jgi:hypothetical protein